MVDIVGSAVRSRMMSGIRGANTRPERLIRSGLWAMGFRFRLHAGDLPGRPDIVLPKWRSVVFVNGCFWHAHDGCSYFRIPDSRRDFWLAKFEANRRRDASAIEKLVQQRWRVIIVWECALRADAKQAISIAAQLIREPRGQTVEVRQDPHDKSACCVQVQVDVHLVP